MHLEIFLNSILKFSYIGFFNTTARTNDLELDLNLKLGGMIYLNLIDVFLIGKLFWE